MDKTLFNFSVTWHNQQGQYVGRCAEFSFLSYLADSDREAYQCILHLVCDFEEQIVKCQQQAEFDKWFAANVQNVGDDTRPAILYKQVLAEIRAFVVMRERCNLLRQLLREKRSLRNAQQSVIDGSE